MRLFSQSTACALIAVANVTTAATFNVPGQSVTKVSPNPPQNFPYQSGTKVSPNPPQNYPDQSVQMVSSNPPTVSYRPAPGFENYRSRCTACTQGLNVKPKQVCEDVTTCTHSGLGKQCRTERKCKWADNSSGVQVPSSIEWFNQKFGTSVQPGQQFHYQEWTSGPTIQQGGFTQTGTQTGTQFGTQFGSLFGSQSGTQTGTQFGTQFGSQIGSQSGTQFGTQFGSQSGNQFITQNGPRYSPFGPTNTNSGSANAHATANAHANGNGHASANAQATAGSTGGWSSATASAQSFASGKK